MSIVRLQLPDGSVPEDIYSCAYGWKEAYTEATAAFAARERELLERNAELARIVGCLEPDEYGRPSCGAPPNGCIVCQTLAALAPATPAEGAAK